jgi:hypothetical protein
VSEECGKGHTAIRRVAGGSSSVLAIGALPGASTQIT